MPIRRPITFVLCAVCTVVLGLASPTAASAAPRVASAAGTVLPTCQLASPENFSGSMLVNNQVINGTWTYATGVACTSNIADIALYEELDLNGTKVDSKLKNFTGVPRELDAITSTFHCATCNGTWQFKWGQILKAPAPIMFVDPPAGCVLLSNGLYQLCAQVKTVTI